MAKDFARHLYRSRAWENVRQVVIDRAHGLCERCAEHGRLTPGYIVHHKVPLTPENVNDPSVALEPSMCMYVCKECHEEIHAELGVGNLHGHVSEEPRVRFDEFGNVVRA